MADAIEGLNRMAGLSLVHSDTAGRAGVRVVRGLQGLDQIQAGWDSLAGERGSPMLSCEWVRACAEIYGLESQLEILVYGAPGVAAIAPLFRSGRVSGRRELMGASDLGEPMNFLFSEAPAVEPLAQALA